MTKTSNLQVTVDKTTLDHKSHYLSSGNDKYPYKSSVVVKYFNNQPTLRPPESCCFNGQNILCIQSSRGPRDSSTVQFRLRLDCYTASLWVTFSYNPGLLEFYWDVTQPSHFIGLDAKTQTQKLSQCSLDISIFISSTNWTVNTEHKEEIQPKAINKQRCHEVAWDHGICLFRC